MANLDYRDIAESAAHSAVAQNETYDYGRDLSEEQMEWLIGECEFAARQCEREHDAEDAAASAALFARKEIDRQLGRINGFRTDMLPFEMDEINARSERNMDMSQTHVIEQPAMAGWGVGFAEALVTLAKMGKVDAKGAEAAIEALTSWAEECEDDAPDTDEIAEENLLWRSRYLFTINAIREKFDLD